MSHLSELCTIIIVSPYHSSSFHDDDLLSTFTINFAVVFRFPFINSCISTIINMFSIHVSFPNSTYYPTNKTIIMLVKQRSLISLANSLKMEIFYYYNHYLFQVHRKTLQTMLLVSSSYCL